MGTLSCLPIDRLICSIFASQSVCDKAEIIRLRPNLLMTINKGLSLSALFSLSLSVCLPDCALTKCNAAMKNGYFMAKNTRSTHMQRKVSDRYTHTHTQLGLGVDTWEICSSSFAGVSRCSKTAPDKNCRRQTGVGRGGWQRGFTGGRGGGGRAWTAQAALALITHTHTHTTAAACAICTHMQCIL